MSRSNNPIIYHNPRCSKSREALSILREHGFEPQIIEYLKTPLNITEIAHLLQLLGISAREILRKNESEYKIFNLDNPNMSEEKIVQLIAENPILMERPIVVLQNKAVIARPPEMLHSFLN
jgi:arsenate reductase